MTIHITGLFWGIIGFLVGIFFGLCLYWYLEVFVWHRREP